MSPGVGSAMLKSIALLAIAILIIDAAVMGVAAVQQAGKLADAGANITSLEDQISTFTGEAASLQRDISSLQASIHDSDAAAAALQGLVTESEAKSAALRDALNKVNTDLLKAEQGIYSPPAAPVFNPTGPAAFVVTDLKINETLLQPADIGTVSVNVTNTGGQTGTYLVVLKLNGEMFATQSVTLDGGKSEVLVFGVRPPKEMHAVITVDNLTVEADWQVH